MSNPCKLDNGTCHFSPKACVGNNPASCGINFGEPGKCNDDKKSPCYFNKDCGEGHTCSGGDHQHINQTCPALLNTFKDKVTCNQGYEAAVSTAANYTGSVVKGKKGEKWKRQPCMFVCNESTSPAPKPDENKGICCDKGSGDSNCEKGSDGKIIGKDDCPTDKCIWKSDVDSCSATTPSKGMSTGVKIGISVGVFVLLVAIMLAIVLSK